MRGSEVERIAPNIADRMSLMRPVMADPPLCSIADLSTRLTIDMVADLHELLDLKDVLASKSAEAAQRDQRRR